MAVVLKDGAGRRKRHVRSRVTRSCRLECSLRVYLDRRARALRFVLRRFGLLLPGRGFFGSVAGLLAAEQTIPRACLLPRGIMAVLALLLLDGCAPRSALPSRLAAHFF